MKKQIQIWQLINNSLEQQMPVMLLYVLQSAGSSPGRQGFFMAVNAAGHMQGSIGGGIMEHKFVEMAREQMRNTKYEVRNTKQEVGSKKNQYKDISIRKQVHNKSAAKNQSGMICSGEQTILLYPVTPEDAGAIGQIIDCLQQNKNGSLQLSPAGLQVAEDHIPDTDYRFTMQSETDWVYEEKLGYKHRLLVIGGGHCALALCRIMHQMDFYIQVFDDRTGLPTLEQNIYAHETNIVQNYQELQQSVTSGNNCYVVVMTVGYRTDDVAIRALLGKSFRYMGILGSKAKIDQLFTTYRQEGVPEETLLRIHAPIGLSIKSETPEEIAVSIAAEIIQVKNQISNNQQQHTE